MQNFSWKSHMEDLSVYDRIILKWILRGIERELISSGSRWGQFLCSTKLCYSVMFWPTNRCPISLRLKKQTEQGSITDNVLDFYSWSTRINLGMEKCSYNFLSSSKRMLRLLKKRAQVAFFLITPRTTSSVVPTFPSTPHNRCSIVKWRSLKCT
jgi:hypothetical protein